MKTWIDHGSVLVLKDDPHGTSVPKGGSDYQDVLAQVKAGTSEIVAAAKIEPTKRLTVEGLAALLVAKLVLTQADVDAAQT